MCFRKSVTGKIKAIPSSIHSDVRDVKTQAMQIKDEKTGRTMSAAYEHPYVVRLCHWANTVSLFVLIGSGLQISGRSPVSAAKCRKKT
jgi:hypothetical protein